MSTYSAPNGKSKWLEADYRRLWGGREAPPDRVFGYASSLRVVASGSDRKVQVLPGSARVQGAGFFGDAEPGVSWAAEVEIPSLSSGQHRSDILVLRYDPGHAERVRLHLILGSPRTGTSSALPSVVRSTTGIWDMPLAYIRSDSTAIKSSDIVDQRLHDLTSTRVSGPDLPDANLFVDGDEIVHEQIRYRNMGGTWRRTIEGGGVLAVLNGTFQESDRFAWTVSRKLIAECVIPNFGRPYRLAIEFGARTGSISAGTRWDYTFNLSNATTGPAAGFIITRDDIMSRYRHEVMLPSAEIFNPGSTKLFCSAYRVVGTGNGEVDEGNRLFKVVAYAA